MSFGILFPGQGSQQVGMGSDVFESRSDLLGERADRILGFSLMEMCLEGPQERLTRTEHAQPALFAISFALWEALRDALGQSPAGAAGHSLGEYTALAASGLFDFDTGLDLVARRGRAMGEAAARGSSGMAALIGADLETAEAICRDRRQTGGSLQVANVNAPGQIVVAGSSADIDWLAENARDLGVRRAIPLDVAGGFHSDFMLPARDALADALDAAPLHDLAFPVWANTTARPHRVESVAETLARQLVEPVLFSASLEDMSRSGIDTFIHVGPGDVTAGLARRSLSEANVLVVSSLAEIDAVVEAIVTMGDS
ncbi:MAG: ACP S-malonyltransferase [Acidimicrobiia bacterium]